MLYILLFSMVTWLLASTETPEEWRNEYRERLHKLVEAKAKGTKLKLVAAKPKEATGDLAESLRASLAATAPAKGKKVA